MWNNQENSGHLPKRREDLGELEGSLSMWWKATQKRSRCDSME